MRPNAKLLVDHSVAGQKQYPVEIVRFTPKMVLIRWILEEPLIPTRSGTIRYKNDVFLVHQGQIKVGLP